VWRGEVIGEVTGYIGRNENALKKVLRCAHFLTGSYEGDDAGMTSSSGLKDWRMNFETMVNCTNWCNNPAA
jgi:hypothetical protein